MCSASCVNGGSGGGGKRERERRQRRRVQRSLGCAVLATCSCWRVRPTLPGASSFGHRHDRDGGLHLLIVQCAHADRNCTAAASCALRAVAVSRQDYTAMSMEGFHVPQRRGPEAGSVGRSDGTEARRTSIGDHLACTPCAGWAGGRPSLARTSTALKASKLWLRECDAQRCLRI